MATAVATVAPENWKEASIRTIKLAQTIINKSDRGIDDARETDPLPLIREVCMRESNDKVHAYVRHTRAVVAKLRESLQATNEEIKSLTRGKEGLEKALEHKRKDLELNVRSFQLRVTRPQREKEPDEADALLKAERSHILTLKKTLEAQLRKVQTQLQVLAACRSRLSSCIQERSRVLELISVPHNSATVGGIRFNRPGSSPSCPSGRGMHLRSQTSPSTFLPSSRPPSSLSMAGSGVGPFFPLTPECVQAMMLAKEACQRSEEIRRELTSAIDHTERLQRSAHESVSEGLVNKLATTVTLTQHLEVNAGETKHAINRGKRLLDLQSKAQGYVLGPVASSDLTTRERLDRPLVRVYQSHPGTDLPEASHLVASQNYLEDSITATQRNISLLKLARERLNSDIKDKKSAAEIDARIVRLRRRRADHRWVLGGSSIVLCKK